MKKTFNKFTIQRTDEPDFSFASYGDTEEKALANCSNADKCKVISCEQIPYELADHYAAIAESLPGQWDASPQSNEHAGCPWYFTRADGLRLHISPPCYNHKTAFAVSLSAGPIFGPYVQVYDKSGARVSYPSVNIGSGKSAEQIAKDITRRLLPDAETVNALVNAQIAKNNAEADLRLSTLHAVSKAFNTPVSYEDREKTRPRFTGHAGDVSFEITYGGNVTLKLHSVPLATAQKIAAALTK